MPPVRPVLHRLLCRNETVRTHQNISFGSNGMNRVRSLRKNSDATLFWRTCAIMALIRPFLHRLSCSNEAVRNATKHEFRVKWSGSSAFVAKNSDATLFSELVREWNQFGQFCIVFRAVMKRSEIPQNKSFGSSGVDRVRSLRKIMTGLCLANLCVNGTSSASFALTFEQ
jgi:hypothetical protein